MTHDQTPDVLASAPNLAPQPHPETGSGGHALPPHLANAAPVGDVFSQNTTFADLGLRSSVMKGVDEAGFKYPTAIQAALIPVALKGKDILGQAKTGTGKTAAFGLPLLHMCSRDVPFQAIILAPTRELAIQITEEIEQLGKHTPIRAMTVYGGQAIHTQAKKLEKGAPIIVGTPGRVMDMVQRGHLHFKNIRFAILDEVDRMLDIGFREDIRKILDMCPPPGPPVLPNADGTATSRQTIFVSATLSPEIERLARKYMHDPEKIVTSSGSLTVSLVKQYHLTVQQWDKRRLLAHLLTHEEPDLTLVFCRLKKTVDDLCRYLDEKGIEAHAMHGDMSQGKRNQTMTALKGGHLAVLIASDLASRGIDVEGISHVINYDLPDDPDLYVHRIGRTARAGRGGIAWSLVTPDQGELLTKIEILINAEVPKLEYPDFKPSDRPAHWRDQGARPEGGLRREDAGGQVAPPPPQEAKMNRVEASSKLALPSQTQVDTNKFPGGIVPTKLPPKRMFGRMKSSR
jgi:ATP-dependent RNA helicase DeaD